MYFYHHQRSNHTRIPHTQSWSFGCLTVCCIEMRSMQLITEDSKCPLEAESRVDPLPISCRASLEYGEWIFRQGSCEVWSRESRLGPCIKVRALATFLFELCSFSIQTPSSFVLVLDSNSPRTNELHRLYKLSSSHHCKSLKSNLHP